MKSTDGRLLVVEPRVLPGCNRLNLYEESHKYPVVVQPQAFEERPRMKLLTASSSRSLVGIPISI